jgi:hypothetical protein
VIFIEFDFNKNMIIGVVVVNSEGITVKSTLDNTLSAQVRWFNHKISFKPIKKWKRRGTY